jgi:glutamate transport system permease protein
VLVEPEVIRFLLGGLRNTLYLFAVSAVLTTIVAVLAALGRLSRSAPLRWLAGTYVELFRAVPLLLLILFSAVVLPDYGVDLPLFWYAVLGLVAYNGAVLGEIFRAGILSLERGQTEAAYAVGLSYWQAMGLVVVPQAARRMIPAVVSQLITLLKDTSLAFVISYEELLRRGRIVGEFANSPLQALLVVALMYIVVNFGLSQVARRLEVRQRRRYRAGAIIVTGGPEDLTDISVESERRRSGGGGP